MIYASPGLSKLDFLVQGHGSPVFHKQEALLTGALLSVPATMGFEFGSGFAGMETHIQKTTTINFSDEREERVNFLFVPRLFVRNHLSSF